MVRTEWVADFASWFQIHFPFMPLLTPLSRLFRGELPTEPVHLRVLFDLYFSRVHPRRCLGFIYRPAWMQSLDQGTLFGDFGEALVLIVCALGARCLSPTTNITPSQASFRHCGPIPGQRWAAKAKAILLSTLTQSSLHNLMVKVPPPRGV